LWACQTIGALPPPPFIFRIRKKGTGGWKTKKEIRLFMIGEKEGEAGE
jgi:hypothetical protein